MPSVGVVSVRHRSGKRATKKRKGPGLHGVWPIHKAISMSICFVGSELRAGLAYYLKDAAKLDKPAAFSRLAAKRLSELCGLT